MKRSPTVLRAGTRPSSLALTQTRGALDRIEGMLGGISFEMAPITSVGDTDRTTDLRESPADFFTRELDGSLLRGDIDLAVHSAKDLPVPMPGNIDWFWLPWREEPRDVLVLSKDRKISGLPGNPVIGVSSERREEYCTKRFPNGIQKNIRGNIEERIEQLDNGDYDVVVMAAAALVRLGLEGRITEWIPLDELEVPGGQGHLAITFREGDERMMALRSLFMHSVTFAGAGVSNKELCTIATLRALKQCDTCLHDSLIDKSLLGELPPHAQAIDVGKRCGAHSREQHETTNLICECARQSKRVVRLKGGDPGIFGRLAEETTALEKLGIPFRVIPGISALQAATTGTGMLLTRRDVSRGFVALTPRKSGGALARCDGEMKNKLPVIYYMSIKAVEPISQQLIDDGRSPGTPVAIIFNAGGEDEKTIKTTLGELPRQKHCAKQPGLIMVGENPAYGYKTDLGALQG
ncbi:MAG: uroporphyrinogen-III C-methyltransferase, partial [Verrucomicrobiota bacterium]|nr:uroporphyrinogen-III C-methyltransferase [Verrucomicrobiota bacterium]